MVIAVVLPQEVAVVTTAEVEVVTGVQEQLAEDQDTLAVFQNHLEMGLATVKRMSVSVAGAEVAAAVDK